MLVRPGSQRDGADDEGQGEQRDLGGLEAEHQWQIERNCGAGHDRDSKTDASHCRADRKVQARLQPVGVRSPQRGPGLRQHHDHRDQNSHDGDGRVGGDHGLLDAR